MDKDRIVVICPGRGAYTRDTAGYLNVCNNTMKEHIEWMDRKREEAGLPTLSLLDASPFKTKIHMNGEHASSLIYACSLSDFFSIDQKKYEIVAITGNSMGWYVALALGGALNLKNGYHLIQTMGSTMDNESIGGQIIYPIIDENWNIKESIKEMILNEKGSYLSILLGGYIVVGGEQKVLDLLLKKLPKKDIYPLQLPFHAAFHTPLMEDVSNKIMRKIPHSIFHKPSIPLIDGVGKIWSPFSTEAVDLHKYTLGYQVKNHYDFTSAIKVAIKEFCPDKLVLLGPGNSLGGPTGQIIIQENWCDVNSKSAFLDLQKSNPYLISMGLKDQRKIVSK